MTDPLAQPAGRAVDAKATILDCTIRDGSYAIDFKFTADDTALIAGLLDDAGLRYIEVGHGLGLGASEAGKGVAASHDLDVIERTRDRVQSAKIGAFFIPGIGKDSDLRAAGAAGLDFIRLGQNADEIEDTWPLIEVAREAGLEVFVNFMKTYGISPSAFADAARQLHARGARGVYVVDSAGGMMPSEVAEYVTATRAACDAEIGFHGHSNLHLAVANSIAAVEAGAEYVDTSVYGIGRSSGNVPTEVMAAVFDRLGIDCGIDAMTIVDIAESYLKPLAEHLHPHDMTAVSLGYGRFHSSYLPRAITAAEQAGINPFRLIVELGRRDMMRLSDELLSTMVAELRDSEKPEIRRDVARFSDPRFGPQRIGNRRQAIADLLDGLEIVAAKRHLTVVLDLVQAPMLDEDVVTAEFVVEDDFLALGRVRFGSVDALLEALDGQAARVGLALLDVDGLDAPSLPEYLEALAGALPGRLVPYRSPELELTYLGDVATRFAAGLAATSIALIDPGRYPRSDVGALESRLESVARVERASTGAGSPDAAIAVVAGPAGSVQREAAPSSEITLFLGQSEWEEQDELPAGWLVLAREDAYRDRLPQWRRSLAPQLQPVRQPVV